MPTKTQKPTLDIPFPHMDLTVFSDLVAENMQFATQFVQHTIETQTSMAACRTPADLMDLQSAYLRDAASACANQAARNLQLATGMAGPKKTKSKSPFKRGYDDVPL